MGNTLNKNALAEARDPPRLWKRYADDTYTVLKRDQVEAFSQYFKTVAPDIQSTTKCAVVKEV